jgi:hypothetical protein
LQLGSKQLSLEHGNLNSRSHIYSGDKKISLRDVILRDHMTHARRGRGGSFIGHGDVLRLLRQGCALPRISSVWGMAFRVDHCARRVRVCFTVRLAAAAAAYTHVTFGCCFLFVKPLLIVISLYLCVFRGLGGVTLARPRRLCRRHRPPVAAARALRRPTCPGRPTCPAQPTVRCRCGCVRGPAPIRSSSPSTSAPMAASAASVMSPSARPARHWRPVVA